MVCVSLEAGLRGVGGGWGQTMMATAGAMHLLEPIIAFFSFSFSFHIKISEAIGKILPITTLPNFKNVERVFLLTN
jgi:hypothetical protein